MMQRGEEESRLSIRAAQSTMQPARHFPERKSGSATRSSRVWAPPTTIFVSGVCLIVPLAPPRKKVIIQK